MVSEGEFGKLNGKGKSIEELMYLCEVAAKDNTLRKTTIKYNNHDVGLRVSYNSILFLGRV